MVREFLQFLWSVSVLIFEWGSTQPFPMPTLWALIGFVAAFVLVFLLVRDRTFKTNAEIAFALVGLTVVFTVAAMYLFWAAVLLIAYFPYALLALAVITCATLLIKWLSRSGPPSKRQPPMEE